MFCIFFLIINRDNGTMPLCLDFVLCLLLLHIYIEFFYVRGILSREILAPPLLAGNRRRLEPEAKEPPETWSHPAPPCQRRRV